MTTLVVLQPNFLPWRGTFDLIRQADVFVFLDDVQYTKNDWRNRNRVLQVDGHTPWLTVPVHGSLNRTIREVEIDYRRDWRRKHLTLLQQSYARAPFLAETLGWLEDHYARQPARLVDLTIPLMTDICARLGLEPRFLRASDLDVAGDKNGRLIDFAQALGATRYLSGPAAQAYIDPLLWGQAGLELAYFDYPIYPAYPQLADGFVPKVSILDLLMMTGGAAPQYIWPEVAEVAE